jgi:hypothetical protein
LLFESERVVAAVEPLAAGALVEPSSELLPSELLPTTAPVDAADHAVNHSDRGTHGTGPWLILSIYCKRNR